MGQTDSAALPKIGPMDGSSPFGEQDSKPQPGSLMSGGGSVREPERLDEPENPNRGRLRSKMIWLAILLVAAMIFVMQVASSDALVENPTPPPQDVPSMELRYASRVNFGASRFEDTMTLPSGSVASSDLSGMLRDYATGPIELVRAAIVAAAVDGNRQLAAQLLDEARLELERLEADLKPLDDEQAQEQRRAWFEDMRRDIEQVDIAASALDGTQLDQDELNRLKDRHGDFGEMVLVIGAPDNSPLRQQFESRGMRTLIAVIVMVSIAGLASLAGFGLFILAIVLLATGRVRRRLNIQSQWSHHKRTLLLEGFLLFLISFIAVSIAAGLIQVGTGLDLQPLLIWLMLLTPFWPLLRGMSWKDLHLALGWHANGAGLRGAIKESSLGLMGYLAGLPIVLAGVLIMFVMIQLTQSRPTHPAVNEATNADFMTALKLYVLASFWAPIVEETVFRGSLYYNLRGWMRPLLSGFIVAFIFAIIHPQGIAVVPALMSLAIVFALMREWRGSMIGPMVAHAVHNAFVMSLVIFVLGA